MKRTFLVAVLCCALQSLAGAELPPFLRGEFLQERLRHGSDHTEDGFYVRVEITGDHGTSPVQSPKTVDFRVAVPDKVQGIYRGKYGAMQLADHYLRILDWRGRTIVSLQLPSWSDDFHHPGEHYIDVTATRKFAAQMEVVFGYGTGGENVAMVKQYIVPLRDYLSSTK